MGDVVRADFSTSSGMMQGGGRSVMLPLEPVHVLLFGKFPDCRKIVLEGSDGKRIIKNPDDFLQGFGVDALKKYSLPSIDVGGREVIIHLMDPSAAKRSEYQNLLERNAIKYKFVPIDPFLNPILDMRVIDGKLKIAFHNLLPEVAQKRFDRLVGGGDTELEGRVKRFPGYADTSVSFAEFDGELQGLLDDPNLPLSGDNGDRNHHLTGGVSVKELIPIQKPQSLDKGTDGEDHPTLVNLRNRLELEQFFKLLAESHTNKGAEEIDHEALPEVTELPRDEYRTLFGDLDR